MLQDHQQSQGRNSRNRDAQVFDASRPKNARSKLVVLQDHQKTQGRNSGNRDVQVFDASRPSTNARSKLGES